MWSIPPSERAMLRRKQRNRRLVPIADLGGIAEARRRAAVLATKRAVNDDSAVDRHRQDSARLGNRDSRRTHEQQVRRILDSGTTLLRRRQYSRGASTVA